MSTALTKHSRQKCQKLLCLRNKALMDLYVLIFEFQAIPAPKREDMDLTMKSVAVKKRKKHVESWLELSSEMVLTQQKGV